MKRPSSLTRGALRACHLALCLSWLSACGRVGYELLPRPADADFPDTSVDAPDAGEDAASELDAANDDGGADGAVPFDGAEPADDGGPTDIDAAPADGSADAGEDAASDAADDAAPSADADARDARADAAADASADADAGAPSSLILRYDFEGTGTTLEDRIGNADGRILGGARLDGSGELTLDGIDDFVDLPNGLVSRLTSVTVMAWVTPRAGVCWERIFDFGSSDRGEGNSGNATSSVSLTTESCPEGALAGLFEYQGDLVALPTVALTANVRTQVALVIDAAAARMIVYANGARLGEAALRYRLSQLTDENAWIGRSQWVQDAYLRARYDEFRIYDRALSAPEIATLNTRGPDAP